MSHVIVFCESFSVVTQVGPDIVDVTRELDVLVKKSGVESGVLNAMVLGSTGSITTIEFEPGVVEDLKRAVDRLAPPDLNYEHEKAWRDGNGHSHVQAALLGPSLVLPVRKNRPALGTWQQVVLINHDNRSRKRRVEVTIIGSTGTAWSGTES